VRRLATALGTVGDRALLLLESAFRKRRQAAALQNGGTPTKGPDLRA